MPRKRLNPIDLTEWVSTEFKHVCPESHREQKHFYLTSAQIVLEWMGPLARRDRYDDGINHVELALLIGGHSMQIMEASNYRAWTSARNLIHFQRALFLRALVIGSGIFTSSHILQNPGTSTNWKPFHKKGSEFFGNKFPKKVESHITVSSSHMEQAIFHHLFPEALTGNPDPMAALAVIDSFQMPGDKENPVVSSLRRGLRKTLLKYRIDPGYVLTNWMTGWYPALLTELESKEVDVSIDDDEEPLEQPASTSRRPAPPKKGSATQKAKAEQFAALVRAGLKEGTIKISCPWAPFHGFRGHPILVWPAGAENLAKRMQARSPEDVEKWFVESGWVETTPEGYADTDRLVFTEQKGEILEKKASVTVALLTERGIKDLLGGEAIPDNPDLAMEEEIDA